MQFNAASASSFAAGSASGATRNYFGAAVDLDLDGFKIPQLPLAGPSHQPIANNQIPKNADSLSPSKKIATRLGGDVRFPSPGSSAEDEIAGSQSPSPNPFQSIRPASRLARSVAPSPASTTLQRIHKDIGCLYAFEAEQGEEIKTLAKEVLFAAYKVWLSTPGDLSSRYRAQIAEILGEGVEKRTVKDTEEIKETGRLSERTPSWDMGYLGRSTTHTLHNVTTPTRSSMPPPSFIPSRKRLREEDSLEDVLEVENSLSLSRNPSINTISSSEDSPAAKRPRLETYEPTINEQEDDAMLGLIWGRYFSTTQEDGDDGEYSPSDDEMEDIDEAECNSDMEVEEEDLSIFALTRGLHDDVLGFIEEAALQEADCLAEEGAAAVPPSSPPAASTAIPIHSFGTAKERPPVPAPRPVPLAPKRLQRSNERITINEDGSIEAFDYTQTEEYADRMAWERHLFVTHGGAGFDNRGGPCDLAADLREITQVGPGGKLLDCHRWQYRFDEQAWRYFEVS